jgi:hypothetical protein
MLSKCKHLWFDYSRKYISSFPLLSFINIILEEIIRLLNKPNSMSKCNANWQEKRIRFHHMLMTVIFPIYHRNKYSNKRQVKLKTRKVPNKLLCYATASPLPCQLFVVGSYHQAISTPALIGTAILFVDLQILILQISMYKLPSWCATA